ncbi:hypothetical protein V494_00218 [Pseudogymnoascus sp. VKM F-4513 (FW-928)]|nr:hypothetical protein V494_00218 [Pseudogymnoascus sp. VKM F-4513 (FW-928)]
MLAVRASQLGQFVNAMKRRLAHELATVRRDEPMQRAICEVGYSKRPAARIQEHIAYKSTNYLMSFFRIIFHDRFPTRRYDIEGNVVLRCMTHEDAAVGEILLTTLAQAYTTDGGGFCHQAAGEKVSKANDIDHQSFCCREFLLSGVLAVESSCCQEFLLSKVLAAENSC